MSGQTAKLSGQVSQHMNLANQTTGQVQQLAQVAQPGQGAGRPPGRARTERPPLRAISEGAGAAVGTEAAERAPLEVAAVGAEPGTGVPRRVM